MLKYLKFYFLKLKQQTNTWQSRHTRGKVYSLKAIKIQNRLFTEELVATPLRRLNSSKIGRPRPQHRQMTCTQLMCVVCTRFWV